VFRRCLRQESRAVNKRTFAGIPNTLPPQTYIGNVEFGRVGVCPRTGKRYHSPSASAKRAFITGCRETVNREVAGCRCFRIVELLTAETFSPIPDGGSEAEGLKRAKVIEKGGRQAHVNHDNRFQEHSPVLVFIGFQDAAGLEPTPVGSPGIPRLLIEADAERVATDSVPESGAGWVRESARSTIPSNMGMREFAAAGC
jgi:hypothetical protein